MVWGSNGCSVSKIWVSNVGDAELWLCGVVVFLFNGVIFFSVLLMKS